MRNILKLTDCNQIYDPAFSFSSFYYNGLRWSMVIGQYTPNFLLTSSSYTLTILLWKTLYLCWFQFIFFCCTNMLPTKYEKLMQNIWLYFLFVRNNVKSATSTIPIKYKLFLLYSGISYATEYTIKCFSHLSEMLPF